MTGLFASAMRQGGLDFRSRLIGIFGLLLVANGLVWVWALVALHDNPVLLGTAFLAYTFGLRHAVDADHIAAIDNATRKLMQDGERPVALGLFFSLGHSSIVICMSVLVGISAANISENFPALKEIGSIVGTFASASFLFILAFFNILLFRSVFLTFRKVKAGDPVTSDQLNLMLNGSGFLTRVFRSLFHMVSKS